MGSRFSDLELFFTSVLFLVSTFICGGPALVMIGRAAELGGGPSLLARLVPAEVASPLYATFVIIPSLLIFVVIGLPLLVKAAAVALRQGLKGRDGAALGLLVAAAVVVALGGPTGWGLGLAVIVALAATLWRATAVLRHYRPGLPALGLAGLALGGLAIFETRLLLGAQPGPALAATMFVVGAYLLSAGLCACCVEAAAQPEKRMLAVALCSAGAAWFVLPYGRDWGLWASGRADVVETASTALLAASTLLVSGLDQVRRRGVRSTKGVGHEQTI